MVWVALDGKVGLDYFIGALDWEAGFFGLFVIGYVQNNRLNVEFIPIPALRNSVRLV